jgi:hypothetical protein
MSTIDFSGLNNDALVYIGRCLAQDPKDLVHFGEACKTTNKIIKNEPFHKLVELEKDLSSLKRRLLELRGPTGSDGLVNQTFLKLKAAEGALSATSRPVQTIKGACDDVSSYTPSPEEENILKDYIQVYMNFVGIMAEYSNLKFDVGRLAKFGVNNEIYDGKIYQKSLEIQSEIKRIQNDLVGR